VATKQPIGETNELNQMEHRTIAAVDRPQVQSVVVPTDLQLW
jgi:hypothetical protein